MEFSQLGRQVNEFFYAVTHPHKVLKPYEVKGFRLGKLTHFLLTPAENWMPYMVLSARFADGGGLETIELRMLRRNPLDEKQLSLFDDHDRARMVVERTEGTAELVDKAEPFINAFYHFPDGVIARLHNENGVLKVGCNGFYTFGKNFPKHSLYTQIASIVWQYVHSQNGKKLGVNPSLASVVLDSAHLISLDANFHEIGIVDPEIEYGWTEDPELKTGQKITRVFDKVWDRIKGGVKSGIKKAKKSLIKIRKGGRK